MSNLEEKNIFKEMGCYGIGITRALAACVEVLSTQKAIKWPKSIVPFQVCIITSSVSI